MDKRVPRSVARSRKTHKRLEAMRADRAEGRRQEEEDRRLDDEAAYWDARHRQQQEQMAAARRQSMRAYAIPSTRKAMPSSDRKWYAARESAFAEAQAQLAAYDATDDESKAYNRRKDRWRYMQALQDTASVVREIEAAGEDVRNEDMAQEDARSMAVEVRDRAVAAQRRQEAEELRAWMDFVSQAAYWGPRGAMTVRSMASPTDFDVLLYNCVVVYVSGDSRQHDIAVLNAKRPVGIPEEKEYDAAKAAKILGLFMSSPLGYHRQQAADLAAALVDGYFAVTDNASTRARALEISAAHRAGSAASLADGSVAVPPQVLSDPVERSAYALARATRGKQTARQ